MPKLHPVTKNGETLLVHPTTLAAHVASGWIQDGDPVDETAPKKGRKPKTETEGEGQGEGDSQTEGETDGQVEA